MAKTLLFSLWFFRFYIIFAVIIWIDQTHPSYLGLYVISSSSIFKGQFCHLLLYLLIKIPHIGQYTSRSFSHKSYTTYTECKNYDILIIWLDVQKNLDYPNRVGLNLIFSDNQGASSWIINSMFAQKWYFMTYSWGTWAKFG